MANLRQFASFALVLACVAFAFVSGCKTSPPSAPLDNPPTVSITSPVNGETTQRLDTIFVNASDDRAVTKVELYANGRLAGERESEPWWFIWNTEDGWPDATYSIYAIAYDGANHSTTSQTISVTVSNAFPVTFYNTTFTTMTVTAGGTGLTNKSGTVLAEDSLTITLAKNPRTLTYTATTSGKTSNGTVIGSTLNWSGSGNVDHYGAANVLVSAPPTYFFIYMKNSGTFAWSPIRVNVGRSDQTTDYISIPNNGSVYGTGYYNVHHDSVVVRGFNGNTSAGYIQWVLKTFPPEANLYYLLWYPTPKIVGKDNVNAGNEQFTGVVEMLPHSRARNTTSTQRSNVIIARPVD